MLSQARIIYEELEKRGWEIISREEPQSKPFWWVKEFTFLRKDSHDLVLTWLIDPMDDKTVRAVSAGKEEPGDRLEAERGIVLWLGHRWKYRMPEFINSIEQMYI